MTDEFDEWASDIEELEKEIASEQAKNLGSNPTITSSVFISHSHADKPMARRIASEIAAHGHRVWIDEAEIHIGDSLLDKISNAIDSVEYIVAILSSNSVNSNWVRQELEIAMYRQINGGRVRVLPIVIDEVEVPIYLRGRLYADLRNPERYDIEITKVINSLTRSSSNIIQNSTLQAPQVFHLSGKQSVPTVLWDVIDKKSTIKGIEHSIPTRLLNYNNIPLQVFNIDIDCGEFDTNNKEVIVNGKYYKINMRGYLYGRCLMAIKYDNQPNMIENIQKDYADFPITIKPYEEILLSLDFKMHFNREYPPNVIYSEKTELTEKILNNSLPLFYGFLGPNTDSNRIPERYVKFIFYTDRGNFDVNTKISIPFPGTKIVMKLHGQELVLNFE